MSRPLQRPLRRPLRAPYAFEPDTSNLSGGVTYNGFLPESIALFNRMSPAPSAARQILIDATIQQLIAAGIWQRLDCLWFMAAETAQAAQLNWLSSSFTLSPVNSPTFTADQGYTGDGVSAYIDTNYTPSTDGVKYLQDDASAGIYVRAAGTPRWWGVSGPSGDRYLTNDVSAADLVNVRFNCSSAQGIGPAVGQFSSGMKAWDRASSSAMSFYGNGALSVSAASTSDGRPQYKVFMFCRNAVGTPSNFGTPQLSMSWLGGSLTAAQHAAFSTIVSTYLSGVGAI